MSIDSLIEHLRQNASSPPRNLVVLYIKNFFLKAQNTLQKLMRYFFAQSKDVPKSLIEKVSFYGERGLKAILGLGVLNLTLTALYFVMPLASATSSLSVFAAIALSALASEIYCFTYNMYNSTFSSSEQKIVEVKSALKEFEQEQTEHRKAIKQILTHFSYEDGEITPKSLYPIQKHLKAMDFDVEQQLSKTQNMSDLAKHFSQPINDYFTQMKKDNGKLHKSYLKELDKAVNSKIKGDKPWSPGHQSFLRSADEFTRIQEILQDNFNIKICFKEALFFQMSVHSLYRPTFVKTQSILFGGEMLTQKDLKGCTGVIKVLCDLGCDENLNAVEANNQLSHIFFAGQGKFEFVYSDYLDKKFFERLEELCAVAPQSAISQENLLRFAEKMPEEAQKEALQALRKDLKEKI